MYNFISSYLLFFDTVIDNIDILFYFSSCFKGLKALQYFNISHNTLISLESYGYCWQYGKNFKPTKRILEKIDLSFNQLNERSLRLSSSSFFHHAGAKELYLGSNFIEYINKSWIFLDKSLRVLDLKSNDIKYIYVSITFLKMQNQFFYKQ